MYVCIPIRTQVAAMKDAAKSLKADYKKINLNDVEARSRTDHCRPTEA